MFLDIVTDRFCLVLLFAYCLSEGIHKKKLWDVQREYEHEHAIFEQAFIKVSGNNSLKELVSCNKYLVTSLK